MTSVEFYVDGVLAATDNSAPYSFSWNTLTASNGSHSLSSKAYDAAGNNGTSASVSVTVNNPTGDTTPPVISGPAAFTVAIPASVANGSTVTVRARARDNGGNLSDERTIVLTIGDSAPPATAILAPAAGAQVAPGQAVTLTVRVTDDTAARMGLAVSRRVSKRAVQRNRLKRLARDSFRRHRANLGPVDILIIARSAAVSIAGPELLLDLEMLWSKLPRAQR